METTTRRLPLRPLLPKLPLPLGLPLARSATRPPPAAPGSAIRRPLAMLAPRPLRLRNNLRRRGPEVVPKRNLPARKRQPEQIGLSFSVRSGSRGTAHSLVQSDDPCSGTLVVAGRITPPQKIRLPGVGTEFRFRNLRRILYLCSASRAECTADGAFGRRAGRETLSSYVVRNAVVTLSD